jgi:hypothetical protein
MFIVILKGNIRIPRNCFGLACPKTSLSRQGLHVLNTGIVEPGYDGYLSTVVMNYSKKAVGICQDDSFLRVMVYESREEYPNTKDDIWSYERYVAGREKDSVDFPDTFLDISSQRELIAKGLENEIINKATTRMGIFLAIYSVILAVIIGLFSYYLTLGFQNTPVEKEQYSWESQIQRERREREREKESLREDLRRRELERLQRKGLPNFEL